MKIHVTAEDIRNGVRKDCAACPIALALQRAGFRNPRVYGAVGFDKGLTRAIAPMPKRAFHFMRHFDAGKPVKPFAFLLAASPDYKPVTP